MPKKKPMTGKPQVNKDLEGFEIQINEFGEINTNMNIDKLNKFLNENVDDKKLREKADDLPDPDAFGRPIRVLVAKVGLDGHDRGAKVIATALKEAGMEVIYTGLRQTPEMVANAAQQEDVDVIGVSILSGAHNTVFPKLIAQMVEKGLDNVLLTGGGIIPEEDMEKLTDMGVGKLFAPGTNTKEIADYIKAWVKENREV